jgi:hypothetical protein
MKPEVATAAPWRPTAYVSVGDDACRARVVDTLQRLGWITTEHASGFHILSALADDIDEGGGVKARVELIVVDEVSHGCSGATLARGLRDLGCSVPIVLVRGPWSASTRGSYGRSVHVVDRAQAHTTIADLVRPWSPISLLQPSPARARALA